MLDPGARPRRAAPVGGRQALEGAVDRAAVVVDQAEDAVYRLGALAVPDVGESAEDAARVPPHHLPETDVALWTLARVDPERSELGDDDREIVAPGGQAVENLGQTVGVEVHPVDEPGPIGR